MIERDDMIREALFCINANNLLSDFEASKAYSSNNTRNILYNIYNNAVKYVTNLSQINLLKRNTQALPHPNLGDNWYYMPLDFVAWAEKIDPVIEYSIDENNDYVAKLMSSEISYLSFQNPISELDVYFRQTVKWQFLNELALSDGSIAPLTAAIKNNLQNNLINLRAKSKLTNISSNRRWYH